MTLALVLSGGGARGDFEVGAVELIYERGFRPGIIAGTSVGAINAAKLAEGEVGPDRGLAGLKKIWHGLRWNSDMWEPEPWLSTIDPALARAVVEHTLPNVKGPVQAAAPGAWGWPAALAYGLGNLTSGLAWLTNDGQKLLAAANAFMNARAVYNLRPIQRLLGQGVLDESRVRAWGAAGGKLRLAAVALESGRLRYVTETGQVVEADGRTPVQFVAQESARAGTLRAQIAALRAEIDATRAELRDAAPGAKGRLAAAVRALGDQVAALQRELEAELRNTTRVPLQVSVGTGAVASSSIGVVFPPVPMGDEQYVDGGHRDTLPLRAALDLQPQQVIAVLAGPPDLQRVEMRDAKVAEIAVRALLDVHLNEILHNELQPPAGWSGTYHLVAPTVEVHDMLTIDPGLVRINIDYGYLRAADTLDGFDRASPQARAVDELTLLRLRQWELECRLFGRPMPTRPDEDPQTPQPAVLAELRTVAAQVAAATRARRQQGRSLPARSVAWGNTWECHPWAVTTRGHVCASVRANGAWLLTGVTEEGGANGRILYATQDRAGTWSGWHALGLAHVPSNSFVAAAPEGEHSNVTWVGEDGWVYLQQLRADGSQGPLGPVGNTPNAPLQAAPGSPVHGLSCRPGLFHVFYANRSGRIVYAKRDAATGTWTEHAGLAGGATVAAGHVTAVSRAPGKIDAFCVGGGGQVFTATWAEGGAWSAWAAIPGVTARMGQHVAAVSRNRDLVDIFVVDDQGRTMSAAFDPGRGWRGWWHIQGGMAPQESVMGAVSRSPDQLDIFVRGRDDRAYTASWSPAAGWAGWWPVNDSRATGAVLAVSRLPNTLDMVCVRGDKVPTVSSWPSSAGWSPARVVNERWDLS